MQLNLPIHKASSDEEILDRIDTLRLHHKTVVVHIEHIYNTIRPDSTLCDTGIEAVATEVVNPIHIQLRADKLVQEMLWIFIFKNIYSEGQRTIHLTIYLLHYQQRNIFMADVIYESIFEHVRERSMPYIVQEHRGEHRLLLVDSDVMPLEAQIFYCFKSEMHGTERVLKASMLCPRIYKAGKAELLYPVQPLKKRMLKQAENQIIRDSNKPMYGVINYFSSYTLSHLFFTFDTYRFYVISLKSGTYSLNPVGS